MGGGGVIRAAAAAKAAGIDRVVHNGLVRCAPIPSQTGQSIRKASIPVATTLTAQTVSDADVAPIEKPAWDAVDQELAMSAGKPMLRVVFDAAPSFKEAKEATSELKYFLDKVYLSSPVSAEFGGLSASASASGLSLISRTKASKRALQAFEMLSTSAQVQNVVASIVSDPNVWNAIKENSELKQFMESQSHISGNVYPNEYVEEPELYEGFQSVFSRFMKKIKLTMGKCRKLSVQWFSDFSTFIQNIFEPPAAEPESADENGNSKTVVSAFMGLAIMAAMVVLMNRVWGSFLGRLLFALKLVPNMSL